MEANECSSPLRIFISYPHDRYKEFVWKVAKDLAELGHQIEIDVKNLPGSPDWSTDLDIALMKVAEDPERGRVLFFMTPHSTRIRSYCRKEINSAAGLRLRILPVQLESGCAVMTRISERQHEDWRDIASSWLKGTLSEEKYRAALERLVKLLRTQPEKEEAEAAFYRNFLCTLLQPTDIQPDLGRHRPRLVERTDLLEKVQDWIREGRTRILLVRGKPGIGKSGFATFLADKLPRTVVHFCVHGTEKADPRAIVKSIAFRFCEKLDETYLMVAAEKARERQGEIRANQLNTRELFERLVKAPFSALDGTSGDGELVVIIDGIDEIVADEKTQLLESISSAESCCPKWVKFILTSRPESSLEWLSGCQVFDLDDEHESNRLAVRRFLEKELSRHAKTPDILEAAVSKLVENSKGFFVYAEAARLSVESGHMDLENPEDFPIDLSGQYLHYFQRQFGDTDDYSSRIAPVLETVLAARDVLDLDFLSAVFEWRSPRQKQAFLRSLGSFFEYGESGIRPFHKSLTDWLTLSDREHDYRLDVREGHRILADFGWREYEAFSEAEEPSEKEAAMSAYTAAYLPYHLAVCAEDTNSKKEKASLWKKFSQLLEDSEFHQASGKNSYERWYQFETDEWQWALAKNLDYVLDHMDDKVGHPTIAGRYFDAFWWWGDYIEYPFCTNLLETARKREFSSKNDSYLIQLLCEFDESYPKKKEYCGRKADMGRWRKAKEALQKLRKHLGLSGDISKVKGDRRRIHLRAITDIYLGEINDALGEGEVYKLYDEAYRLVGRISDDSWIKSWVDSYHAEIRISHGDLDKARKLCLRALKNIEDDHEVTSNIYRHIGDINWLENRFDEAMDAYRLAVFYALREQVVRVVDKYTVAHYCETVDRILLRLKEMLNTDSETAACECDRWNEFWKPYWGLACLSPQRPSCLQAGTQVLESAEEELRNYVFPPVPVENDPDLKELMKKLVPRMNHKVAQMERHFGRPL